MRDIVLIEDSDSDIFLMQRLFKKAGLSERLVIQRDGQEALNYLNTHPDQRLILVDLNLPGITGGELIRRIRNPNRFPGAHIAILSTSPAKFDQRPDDERLEDEYWQKPDDIAGFLELKAKIQDCLLE